MTNQELYKNSRVGSIIDIINSDDFESLHTEIAKVVEGSDAYISRLNTKRRLGLSGRSFEMSSDLIEKTMEDEEENSNSYADSQFRNFVFTQLSDYLNRVKVNKSSYGLHLGVLLYTGMLYEIKNFIDLDAEVKPFIDSFYDDSVDILHGIHDRMLDILLPELPGIDKSMMFTQLSFLATEPDYRPYFNYIEKAGRLHGLEYERIQELYNLVTPLIDEYRNEYRITFKPTRDIIVHTLNKTSFGFSIYGWRTSKDRVAKNLQSILCTEKFSQIEE